MMRILRAEHHRRMPWKNGGGVTTEVAVFPEGAGLDDFGWRISMATVAADGPFSLFPGVDRSVAVLEGDGIVLSVEGMPDVGLTGASQPFSFPADRPTSAQLISGPIVDLNVMTRRGRFAHSVKRLAPDRTAVARDGVLTVLFCAAGAAIVSSAGERAPLTLHDAAIADVPHEIEPGHEAELYLVTLTKI